MDVFATVSDLVTSGFDISTHGENLTAVPGYPSDGGENVLNTTSSRGDVLRRDNVSFVNATDGGGPQILSDFAREMFILINHVILSMSLCLLGIVGNTINIVVFVKQGLRQSVNSSFFAMSISDLLGLVFQVWHNFCLNPYVDKLDAPIDFLDVQYLTAGWPNSVLVRITGWITVYVTAERCLSIAVPLKIKQIVTPRRTAAILVFIYVINIASLLPLYFSAYFSWNFYPAQNRTKFGISFRSNKLEIEYLIFTFQASLAIIAFACVIIFTTILVVKLKQKSKWRRSTTFDREQSDTMSSRERKTINMVVVVATVLIVCYIPAVTCSITTSLTSDFGITGRQSNLFHMAWSFGFLFHSINSSISILLYYRMSSKYKKTFHEIFPRCATGRGATDARDEPVSTDKSNASSDNSLNSVMTNVS